MATRAHLSILLAVSVISGGSVDWGGEISGIENDCSLGVEKVFVEKSARRLSLLRGGKLCRTYRVALGRNPLGAKEREGDGRTPEGQYVVSGRNLHSNFHRALRISYPNKVDKARAASLGVSPGGDIMIHGIQNGLGWLGPLHRVSDWTEGCIAVTDAEIEEIWNIVKDGTPVEIVP